MLVAASLGVDDATASKSSRGTRNRLARILRRLGDGRLARLGVGARLVVVVEQRAHALENNSKIRPHRSESGRVVEAVRLKVRELPGRASELLNAVLLKVHGLIVVVHWHCRLRVEAALPDELRRALAHVGLHEVLETRTVPISRVLFRTSFMPLPTGQSDDRMRGPPDTATGFIFTKTLPTAGPRRSSSHHILTSSGSRHDIDW